MHFPIPRGTLVVSALLANLVRPLALAELPLLFSASLALSRQGWRLPLVLAGLGLSFVFVVAASQLAGLLLHGLSRSRRLHDLSLFLGLLVGFAVSLLPILLVSGGGLPLVKFLRGLLVADVFAWSPFAWGLRAAVHVGRGEAGAALAWGTAAVAAIVAVLGACGLLIDRIYRGGLDLGGFASASQAPRARMWFGGVVGSVVEKDLRSAWRDPGLKATLLMGLVSPLVFLFFLSRAGSSGGSDGVLLMVAAMIGISSFGANAFGFERRALSLLFSFPAERWRLLLAKNLAWAVFRLPGILTLLIAGVLMVPLSHLPAALAVAAICWLQAAGLDNYLSILFPVAAPAPGRNPYAGSAGRRGFGAAAIGALLLFVAMALAAPFVFLAWLPLLLGRPWLWLVCIPLALAGAFAVYALLLGGAERLLLKREPELLERVLGEA